MAWLNAAFAAVDLAIGFFVSFLKDNKILKASCGGGKDNKNFKSFLRRGEDNRDNRDNFFITNHNDGKSIFFLLF